MNLHESLLIEILLLIGNNSSKDLLVCRSVKKQMLKLSRSPFLLQNLQLSNSFNPPYSENTLSVCSKIFEECVIYNNIDALFFSGLNEYFFIKNKKLGCERLTLAAKNWHSEAMYILGVILIGESQITQGSFYLLELWRKKGTIEVIQCFRNLRFWAVELTMSDYRCYEDIIDKMVANKSCGYDLDERCEDCVVYKELYEFLAIG